MALTRDFKDTLEARVERDQGFREALLGEAVSLLLEGDVQTGKAILRDFINATVGLEQLAARTGTPAKSLMRMFGPRGNPTAANLFSVLQSVQSAAGVKLAVQGRPAR